MTTTGRTSQADNQVSAYTDLARRIKEEGLLERSPRRYVPRVLLLVAGYGAAMYALLSIGKSWWQLLVAAGFGVLFTQTAFLGHDAAHRQIFTSGRWNEWTSRVVANGIVGLSHGWWMRKHSRHHANPNKVGADEDIRPGVILFTTEDVALRTTGLKGWFTARQGWLFFPLLTLEGLSLHVGAIRTVVTEAALRHRRTETALLGVRLLGWPLLVVSVLGPGLGTAFLAVQLMVFGIYMGASFAPNHKGMPLVARDTTVDFLSRQVLTSRNVRGGRWVDWLMGGLNLQIEHHLFPSMPSSNLRRAQQIVREYCSDHDVPYTEAGLLESYGIVVRHLNRVGLSDRDPFTCPFVVAHRTG
ncbi:fatty acid desaturase family protein [Cellulosimicrobium cellulans]|uniref:fatty acid desaturase family protein n=1 Tax=Cellulosimicrobium cellulans TaxID=1710 RepID=UPI00382F7635